MESKENAEKTAMVEESVNELKEQLIILSHHTEETKLKLIQVAQRRDVFKKQAALLKEQAHNLNKAVIVEQMKLDDIRRQTEAHVEDFVYKINCALEKNKHVLEANGETAVKTEMENEESDGWRRKYFQLKGEMEALRLFKEYQECVIDEIQKVEESRSSDAVDHNNKN